MAASLRHIWLLHRMGRHGLPNFLVLREGIHPCDGIRWRCLHRHVHRYHAAGARDYCEQSPTARLADPPAPGRASCDERVQLGRLSWWCAGRAALATTPWRPRDTAGKAAGCVLQRLAGTIVPVAAQHSPSLPFLVSQWVGAQALTDQGRQP
jgi:hypothetical protein